MPKKILKWLGLGLLAVLALLLLALGLSWLIIGSQLNGDYQAPVDEVALDVPVDAASIDEGLRQARLRGCASGCHGEDGYGSVFFETPDGSRMVAPNLQLAASRYSDTELEQVIRHGIRPDGSSVLAIMPTAMFYHLDDRDLELIIAWMRSLPPTDEELPETWVGPLMSTMILIFSQLDDFEPVGAKVVAPGTPVVLKTERPPEAWGHYLAMTTCSECHGTEFTGAGDTPDLAIARAYSREQFGHLMQTGEPISAEGITPRELGLMASVARYRFAHFTEEEVDALYAFLTSRTPPAATSPGEE